MVVLFEVTIIVILLFFYYIYTCYKLFFINSTIYNSIIILKYYITGSLVSYLSRALEIIGMALDGSGSESTLAKESRSTHEPTGLSKRTKMHSSRPSPRFEGIEQTVWDGLASSSFL